MTNEMCNLNERPMRALLIYPEVPQTLWSLTHALRLLGKRTWAPPLGLLTVAAMLPAGTERRLIDINTAPLADADILWADYVFISAMAVQNLSARRLIDRVKALGKPIVAGGPLFTSTPEDFADVDHLILNEAEITFPPFLRDLDAGKPQPRYTSAEFSDMTVSPVPAYELLDPRPYGVLAIQYSRGCPHQCEFCNVTSLFGHRPRIKTAEQIIAELDQIYRRGWRGKITFVDDNLLCNRTYLKSTLLPAIIEWRKGKPEISFHTQVTVTLADDPELVVLMRQAGFDMVFIGIETPDEQSLAECKKRQNLKRDLLGQVHLLQEHGIQVLGGFIVGFDHDDPSIFRRQFDFIQQSGIVLAMVGILQAPPQTPLFERMRREGRLKRTDFTPDSVTAETNFVPKMDAQVLADGYKQLAWDLYAPNYFYERVRHFLERFEVSTEPPPFTWSSLQMLTRCFLALGCRGRGVLQFWRCLFWVLSRKPKAFGDFIALALFGHHFRTVYQGIR